MKKGIVMESTNIWTVVLTSDGEFIKIPFQPDHCEGAEVAFHNLLVDNQSKDMKVSRWKRTTFRGGAIVAACMLIFLIALPFFGQSESYAAVTIEINPSVELSVDKQGKVVQVDSFTKAGQQLLREVAWENESLPIVTLNIIDQARLMGYLAERRQVLITTTYLREDRTENIRQLIANNVSVDQELTVVLIEADLKYRKEAKEKDVSLGSYMLERVSRKEGLELTGKSASDWDVKSLPAVQEIEVLEFKNKKGQPDDQPSDPIEEIEKTNDLFPMKQIENQKITVEQEETKQSKQKQSIKPQQEMIAPQIQRDASIAEKNIRIEPAWTQNPQSKEPGRPARVNEKGPPAHVKERITPARSKEPGPPARVNEKGPPAHVKERITPARSKEPGPPARLNEKGPPAHAKERITPARSKDTIRPPHAKEKELPTRFKEKENQERRSNERNRSKENFTP